MYVIWQVAAALSCSDSRLYHSQTETSLVECSSRSCRRKPAAIIYKGSQTRSPVVRPDCWTRLPRVGTRCVAEMESMHGNALLMDVRTSDRPRRSDASESPGRKAWGKPGETDTSQKKKNVSQHLGFLLNDLALCLVRLKSADRLAGTVSTLLYINLYLLLLAASYL